MKTRSILFVCTGNTCRSPMAVAILRQLLEKEGIPDVEVFSRGISPSQGLPISEPARDALLKGDIPVLPHHAQLLSHSDIEKADVVYGMTREHVQAILMQFPDAKIKTRTLAKFDIADPIGGSPSDYEKCRIDIQNILVDLISDLKSEGSSKS